MEKEIKIGDMVKLMIKDCPSLIVENIKSVITSDGIDSVQRKVLTCVWFDYSSHTFKHDDFYLETVYLGN